MKLKTLAHVAFVAVAAAALIVGTAATGEAKGKKKKEAAPSGQVICNWDYKPVCANDHGIKHTYSNACIANVWGAKMVSPGPCK